MSFAERPRLPRIAWFALGVPRRRSEVRMTRNRSLTAGIGTLVTMLVLALVGVIVLPDPNSTHLLSINLPPGSGGHLLGTDALGRDVLAWTSAGVWVALGV